MEEQVAGHTVVNPDVFLLNRCMARVAPVEPLLGHQQKHMLLLPVA
jgi:hypothetical protein